MLLSNLFAFFVVWTLLASLTLFAAYRAEWGVKWAAALHDEGSLWARIFGLFLLPAAVFGWLWGKVDYAMDNSMVMELRAIVRLTLFGPDKE